MAPTDIPRPQGISNIRDAIMAAAASGILPGGVAAASAGSGSSVFNVPVGPPQTVGTNTFVNPDAPYVSLYDPVREEIPTMTNEQIKQDLAIKHALDPNAQVAFEKDLARSGYGSIDELLYASALSQQPWEDLMASRAASGLFGSGGSGGPTTTVTTNISNRGQAYDAINPQFERGLGRSIGTDELTDFRKTLNKFEKANPYVTNSGRGYSKTTGGFDSSELVRSYVEGQDDYAESQVASNFLGVLDRILQDPNNQPGPDLQTRMDRAGY